MTRPSKQELREAHGRSILYADHTPVTFDHLLTTRPHFSQVLSEDVKTSLRVLYPYIQDAPLKLKPEGTLDNLLSDSKHNIFPEGDIFFWKKQVLCTLHALKLWVSSSFDPPRPTPPSMDSLSLRATKKRYFGFSRDMRVHFHETVFSFSIADREQCAEKCSGKFCIADAMREVEDQHRDEGIRIQKHGARRFAKVFGAMCASCKNVGKGMMACSRCHKVFYCGRDCQKAQWPQHKKDCMKIGLDRATSTTPGVN